MQIYSIGGGLLLFSLFLSNWTSQDGEIQVSTPKRGKTTRTRISHMARKSKSENMS
jgi:hypothetical protein